MKSWSCWNHDWKNYLWMIRNHFATGKCYHFPQYASKNKVLQSSPADVWSQAWNDAIDWQQKQYFLFSLIFHGGASANHFKQNINIWWWARGELQPKWIRITSQIYSKTPQLSWISIKRRFPATPDKGE